MIIVRSLLFNVLFWLDLVLHVIATVAVLPAPRRLAVAVAGSWARSSAWLLRTICGITLEWNRLEKIPPGPLIVACKHQSVLDVVALVALLGDPACLVKRELTGIPLLGWCLRKVGMIAVDRGAGALAATTREARRELDRGRRIIVFPEGVCRAPGAPPAYRPAVAGLYAGTGVPCLPVALNSGLAWPHRSLKRHPGTVRIAVLDVIEPGLPAGDFLQRLEDEIERATARLIAGRLPSPG